MSHTPDSRREIWSNDEGVEFRRHDVVTAIKFGDKRRFRCTLQYVLHYPRNGWVASVLDSKGTSLYVPAHYLRKPHGRKSK